MNCERVAIVGTAQSWKQTPWNDPGLRLWSLNDAYQLKGFERADAWFDLHPPNKWWSAPDGKPVFAHQVPFGHYVRPPHHVEWLSKQTIPVYLHPDYATLRPELMAWPHARAFPKDTIEAAFGRYFTSSPAWMIAKALQQGCRELHIYGIHLATESEYIEQRPNFEYLIGRLLGSGKLKTTIKDGLRHYETNSGHVILPEASPVLNSAFQYAFEPSNRRKLDPLRWEQHKVTVKFNRAVKDLRELPWWKSRKPLVNELARLEAWAADVNDRMAKAEVTA